MNCTPSTLANTARCFKHCSSQMGIQSIKTMILCKTLNAGGLRGTAPEVMDWSARVVANGGAAPSANTTSAMSNFVGTLKTAGLWSKMYVVNCVAPDNLIAIQTPLKSGGGSNLWGAASGQLMGQLNWGINGFIPNGSPGAVTGLLTGWNPSTMSGWNVNNGGMTFYGAIFSYGPSNTNSPIGGADSTNAAYFDPVDSGANPPGFTCRLFGASSISGQWPSSQPNYSGYFSFNRTNSSTAAVYFANGSVAHNLLPGSSYVGGVQSQVAPNVAMDVAGINSNGTHLAGTGSGPLTNTFSFFAFHDGLTQAQSATLFNAVQTMRIAMGGGYYPLSPADDWSQRVVVNGGTAPSAGTKSALTTFANSLTSAGIWSKMIAINCFAPDSLIAAITPLLKGSGNDPWTNTGFVSGDLTINGLKADGSTKWLNTGVKPGVVWPVGTLVEGGMTIYVSQGDNSSAWDMGAWFSNPPSVLIGASDATGNAFFGCYGYTVGTDEITYPIASFTGFLSGSRTSPTALAFYGANSSLGGFQTLGSLTGVTSENGTNMNATIPIYCFGAWNSNVGYFLTAKRLSFSAIHNGLTSSETQALYNAVRALRVSLGGGYV